jgi:hypothetical protein
MNPLELRKIILVGSSEGPIAALAWTATGAAGVAGHPVTLRIAFWLPAPRPYKRCAGSTEVPSPFDFEVQALKDGAIIEHVQEFEFPEQPSFEEMRRRLMPVWEGLTVESLGVLPNGAPEDHAPKFQIQFTAT